MIYLGAFAHLLLGYGYWQAAGWQVGRGIPGQWCGVGHGQQQSQESQIQKMYQRSKNCQPKCIFKICATKFLLSKFVLYISRKVYMIQSLQPNSSNLLSKIYFQLRKNEQKANRPKKDTQQKILAYPKSGEGKIAPRHLHPRAHSRGLMGYEGYG